MADVALPPASNGEANGASAPPGDAELRQAVKDILKAADLSQLTSKKVRAALTERYDRDFTDRKKEIDGWLLAEIEAQNRPKSPAPPAKQAKLENDTQAVAAIARPANDTAGSDSDDSGPDDAARIKYRPPKYDAALAREIHDGERRTRRGGRAPPKPKAAPKEKKPRTTNKKTGYQAPCVLSEELAALVGSPQMPRHAVVKWMWEYFRANDLLDPRNKQFVRTNDALFTVFKCKRFRAFGMMKFLSKHLKQADLVTDASVSAAATVGDVPAGADSDSDTPVGGHDVDSQPSADDNDGASANGETPSQEESTADSDDSDDNAPATQSTNREESDDESG